jgi:Resolvase, N terminal domain
LRCGFCSAIILQEEWNVTKERSAQKRIAIYLRVSTGEQTTENQKRELEEVAAREGWRVVDFFEDAGISGAKSRSRKLGFRNNELTWSSV